MSLYGLVQQRMSGLVGRVTAGAPSTMDNFFHLGCLQQVRFKNTIKSSRAIAKRIRVRGNGSLKRMKSGAQHNTGYKSRQKSNKLTQSTPFKNKAVEKKMKRCLGVS